MWFGIFSRCKYAGKIHLKQSTEPIFVKTTGVNCDYKLADLEKAKKSRKEQGMPCFYS